MYTEGNKKVSNMDEIRMFRNWKTFDRIKQKGLRFKNDINRHVTVIIRYVTVINRYVTVIVRYVTVINR